MAAVNIEFSDDINNEFDFEDYEIEITEFINKYQKELGPLAEKFYDKEDEGFGLVMKIFRNLQNKTISTRDSDEETIAIFNLLSKWAADAEFEVGFGYKGFKDEFYEDLFSIFGDIRIEFQATVLGSGDEFYKCSYDLTKDGWTGHSDLYVWNEEYSTYECQWWRLVKIKEYLLKNLLDDYDDIIKRCHLIKEVSNSVSFIPNTQITISGKTLVYEQELLEKHNYRGLTNQKKIELLGQFSKDLDSLIPYGFVHGDINYSNVLYDGIRLNLIDLEPSFKQIKYGKKVVMSGVPLRSLIDLKNRTITVETDKIGFYLSCNRLMNIPLNLDNQRELMKKRRNGYEFLPMKESEFMKLSFPQIFDYFRESIN